MTLDIRGSLKNTKIKPNAFVVFDELLSNAIDSYLIRKNNEPELLGLEVNLLVEFFDIDFEGRKVDFKITCSDNGAGFSDGQVKAFATKDTTFKDDLGINGIGLCKGSGRIQFLHYFSRLKIDSSYKDADEIKHRVLRIDSSIKEIDESSFEMLKSTEQEIKTTFTLDLIKPDIYERFFDSTNLREEFSVESLKNHVMFSFLQRFVSLKNVLGDFKINFETIYVGNKEETSLDSTHIPSITSQKPLNIPYKLSNGKESSELERFTVSHYKLNKSDYKLKRNYVGLCAKSSAVKNIVTKYLKTKALENNDIDGYYHIVLVESHYLDERVNTQRDDFDIPTDSQLNDLYLQKAISWEQIYDSIDEIIYEMVSPPDWDKEGVIKNLGMKYGISPSMISDAKIRVHYGDTEDSVVKRVLSSYQTQIIKDTSDIFDIKQEISQIDPTSKEFRKKVNELAWKYTSSLKSIDMANLSQVVVRRTAIIDILTLAIERNLLIQTENEGRRYDEKIIHNIFFPMGKDNTESADHDVWLLNEEYHYYDYIASDKSLATLTWDENTLLFESDIDESLELIFKKNTDDNKAKRPDIAIFSKEGSAIIIEFKAPDENLDDHTGDLMEYAQLLAAKSNGKLKKFYGYLIGTDVNPNRIRGYTRFPEGKGWFGTEAIMEHSTGKQLGELYSEIIFYDDIVNRANKRIDIYKKRLGIDFSSNT